MARIAITIYFEVHDNIVSSVRWLGSAIARPLSLTLSLTLPITVEV